MTKQKRMIHETLMQRHDHPTAEQLYGDLKRKMPRITLATVYRNLNAMAKEGKIRRIEANSEYHYDAECCCHQHYICKTCGKIMDHFDEKIGKYAMKNFRPKDFQLEGVHIIYYGTCRKAHKA